jgi:hypothetical protein
MPLHGLNEVFRQFNINPMVMGAITEAGISCAMDNHRGIRYCIPQYILLPQIP